MIRLTLALAFLLCAHAARAQDEAGRDLPRFSFWGELQTRASVGLTDSDDGDETRVGWGVRRARARFVLTLSDGLGANYDVDVGSGSLQSVDLFAFYQPNENLRFRVGRMAGSQPRAHIGTLLPYIDAVSRPAIAERWGRGTVGGDGRDFGIDVRYQTDELELSAFLHNGDGSFATDRGNVRQEISGGDATGGLDRVIQAVSVYAGYAPAALPGFEVGGYAGYNSAEGPNTGERPYVSYAGHLYWGPEPGSQPVRLKADAIGIRYEDGGSDQHVLGLSLLGAVRATPFSEVFARAETLIPDLDDDRTDVFVTAGASLSVSALRGLAYHQERFTLAYANGLPDVDNPVNQHLVVVQFQIVF